MSFDQSDFNDFSRSGKSIEDRPDVVCNSCYNETQGIIEYNPDDGMHYWYCDSDKPTCRHGKGGPGPTMPLSVAKFSEWRDFFPEDFEKHDSENKFHQP